MTKLYSRSFLVIVRDDEEARNRNWVTDQEDYYISDLGRGLWSVKSVNDDGSLGRELHVRTSELERRYLRRPETFVKVYKAVRGL